MDEEYCIVCGVSIIQRFIDCYENVFCSESCMNDYISTDWKRGRGE